MISKFILKTKMVKYSKLFPQSGEPPCGIGLVLTCSDAQNVQWWIEMCSDERLFVQWQKRSFGNLAE